MPKYLVGELFPLHQYTDSKVSVVSGKLAKLRYGEMLSDGDVSLLTTEEKLVYAEYVYHVRSVKR